MKGLQTRQLLGHCCPYRRGCGSARAPGQSRVEAFRLRVDPSGGFDRTRSADQRHYGGGRSAQKGPCQEPGGGGGIVLRCAWGSARPGWSSPPRIQTIREITTATAQSRPISTPMGILSVTAAGAFTVSRLLPIERGRGSSFEPTGTSFELVRLYGSNCPVGSRSAAAIWWRTPAGTPEALVIVGGGPAAVLHLRPGGSERGYPLR
jgi:hypothetical protein